MTRHGLSRSLALALMLAAASGLASGCTLFGDRFQLEEPTGEITVVGEIQVDTSAGSEGCPAGRTIFWGQARNTGDVDLDDISIVIDAYNSAGGLIGSFSGGVFSGDITSAEDGSTVDTASTSLAVEESGSFAVCAAVSAGSVARTEYHTSFTYIDDSGTE